MSATTSLLNAGEQANATIQPMSGGGGEIKDVRIFGVPYKLRNQADLSEGELAEFNTDEKAILGVFGVNMNKEEGFEAANGRKILRAIYEAGCADDVSVATAGKCGPVAALLMGVAVEALNKMKGMEFVSASRIEPPQMQAASGEFIYITMRVPISAIKTTIAVTEAAPAPAPAPAPEANIPYIDLSSNNLENSSLQTDNSLRVPLLNTQNKKELSNVPSTKSVNLLINTNQRENQNNEYSNLRDTYTPPNVPGAVNTTSGGGRTTRRRLRGGNGLQVSFADQQTTKTSS
jgi:hypothetical protein